ncbi:MAG: hypothetical protein JNN15_05235 [Blastocatellia bacterium]|nr:hypothetical protein [Blastocatellia bacterium]
MNWLCANCGFDIHIDDTQVPPYAFSVDCPRCRKNQTVTPPAKPDPTLKVGSPPANRTTGARSVSPQNPQEFSQMFMQVMQMMMGGQVQKGGTEILSKKGGGTDLLSRGFAWQRKQVLICCADAGQRQSIETILEESNSYEYKSPQTSAQALDFLHESKIEIVILDPQFDATRQGGIAVLRYISSLMPKYRRRIYVALVSPQVKTLDTYMAFLNCVNLTINTEDIESLPAILDKSIKDFNELYKPFYEASSISPF